MNNKKIIFDIIFITLAAIVTIVLNKFGLMEKYINFALIPILIAYYLGKFVEKKTRTKSKQ